MNVVSSWIGALCYGQEADMNPLVTVCVSHAANLILTGGLFACRVAYRVN